MECVALHTGIAIEIYAGDEPPIVATTPIQTFSAHPYDKRSWSMDLMRHGYAPRGMTTFLPGRGRTHYIRVIKVGS